MMNDNGSGDEKIIAVPVNDPNYNGYSDIDQLPQHRFDEIKHFFEVYKMLEEKVTIVDEICGREEALKVIQNCIDAYDTNVRKYLK